MRIGVVDYGAGNLKSVETALRFLKTDFFTSDKPEEILTSDRLVFPGVGEAASAMANLERTGLAQAIQAFFESGRLILGICLGSQIILARSEERDTLCLGIIAGTARHFPRQHGLKVPHMGWNQVMVKKDHPLFNEIPGKTSFYFVHSYYPNPATSEDILAETEYIINFPSAISYKNLAAVQFHPEKSGRYGLRLLENFLKMKD